MTETLSQRSAPKKLKRRLILVILGIVIIPFVTYFLINVFAELRRVSVAQAMVEDRLAHKPDPAITAECGRFLRLSGWGYHSPPFMSPGGDVLIADRTAYFDKGSIKMRIYTPGLSSSFTNWEPYFQFNPDGPEILVNFRQR